MLLSIDRMGGWFSKETQTISTGGHKIDNLVIQNPETHLVVLVSVICGLKIFELVVLLYRMHNRYLVRRYEAKNHNKQNPALNGGVP